MIRNLVLAFFFPVVANATTWNCATASYADVAAKADSTINTSLADGDIVVIPAATVNWTSGLTVTKAITLQGAGTGATGGGDQTVITDNSASGSPLIQFQASVTVLTRMTGITVQSGTGATKDSGTVLFIGPSSNIRVDHCHFNSTSLANYKIILFYLGAFGVMDHCVLDLKGTNAVYFANGRIAGGDNGGNYEWTLPTNFGGSDYFYIEDSIINGIWDGIAASYSTRVWDGWTSSKVVVRFNTVSQSCLSEAHATGHSGDDRGVRSQEVYGNSVTSSLAHDPNNTGADLSNGTGLVWGNSWNQVYKSFYRSDITRKNNVTYTQTATPGGWGYAGTAFNGTGSNWDGGTANSTDTTLGYPALDQPGRGQCDMIDGSFPTKTNHTTGTIHWPNQALEPVYAWNNTGTVVAGFGDSIFADLTGGRVVTNRDIYFPASGIQTNATTPFDGTTGTGWGTIANRPTTCTTGVGYFATNQGSWNTSATNPYGVQQNGASGILYKCTSTNTWTLYYTPYTYPHPLNTSGGGGSSSGHGKRPIIVRRRG